MKYSDITKNSDIDMMYVRGFQDLLKYMAGIL